MAGETSLATLLRSMSPQLNDGEYVFCSLPDRSLLQDCEVLGSFREREGLTVIPVSYTHLTLPTIYSV